MYLKDLSPLDFELVYEHFNGTGSCHLVDGWQDFLKELDLSRHIGYLESLGYGKYTCENGLLDLLVDTGITIRDFQEKLLHVDRRRKIPRKVKEVRDKLDEALQVRKEKENIVTCF